MTTSNISSLADQYAAVKLEIEKLENQLKLIKKDIVATGRDVIEGEAFKVTVGLQERRTITISEAEKELSADVFNKLVHVSEYEVVRFRPIAQ